MAEMVAARPIIRNRDRKWLALSELRTTIEFKELFESYLMFRPEGEAFRYVPLRKANWNWGGKATAADGWAAVTDPLGDADAVGLSPPVIRNGI